MSQHCFVRAIGTAAALLVLGVSAHAQTISTIAELSANKRAVAYMATRTMLEAAARQGIEQDKKFGLQQDSLMP